MVETEILKTTYAKTKDRNVMVLQCHGIPCSGKSQIIRKLAYDFPFEKENGCLASGNGDDINSGDGDDAIIKWHIQCQDSGDSVKEELKHLAKKLVSNSFNVSQDNYQDIIERLNKEESDELVDTLLKTKKSVLIVIEDPGDKDKKLMDSLCRSLKSNSERKKCVSTKFHIYITSSNRTLFQMKPTACNGVFCCNRFEMSGFTEQESIAFLNKELKQIMRDDEAARKIHKHFSGLPLGLRVAKRFCIVARINYSRYLEYVADQDYDIISDEKSVMVEMKHVFQALVMPFKPNDKNDAAAELPWKILCCISFFHYDRIPRFVVEECCSFFRESKIKKPDIKNKIDVGNLISKLKQYGMCTETDEGEITFHEVVLNAFRFIQRSDTKHDFNLLKKALLIICSLVSKDMRNKEHADNMYKMRRHLQSLLKHIGKDKRVVKNPIDIGLASHLHEITGAIMLSESKPSIWKDIDQHFEMALKLIWPNANEYLKPTSSDNDEATAEKIVRKSQERSALLPEDFTVRYVSKLKLSFDDQELEFLKSRSCSESKFEEMKQLYQEQVPPKDLVKKLQECELLSSDYRTVFYAARFAFIMHSWSRMVLFADAEEDVEKLGEKCIRRSNLSYNISNKCKKLFQVSLLAEHLSKMKGLIPIIIKLKRPHVELEKVLDTCKQALEEKTEADAPVFENGLLREVYTVGSNVSFNVNHVPLLRSIVIINARLNNEVRPEEDVKEADEMCHRLFELSVEHAKTKSTCLLSIINCAKYYGARKDFSKSLNCFHKYFELGEKCSQRFNVLCWATCNYARAVKKYKDCPLESKKDVVEKCQKVLEQNDVMNKTTRERLKKLLEKLSATTQ